MLHLKKMFSSLSSLQRGTADVRRPWRPLDDTITDFRSARFESHSLLRGDTEIPRFLQSALLTSNIRLQTVEDEDEATNVGSFLKAALV